MDEDIKQMFDVIMQKLENIEKRQANMEKSQANMEISQENMEKRQVSMEKRQDEIFTVVKAIEHSNNIHKAEIDNLTYKVAHIEGTINKVGDVIESSRAIK